jgi:hypothetical protein
LIFIACDHIALHLHHPSTQPMVYQVHHKQM